MELNPAKWFEKNDSSSTEETLPAHMSDVDMFNSIYQDQIDPLNTEVSTLEQLKGEYQEEQQAEDKKLLDNKPVDNSLLFDSEAGIRARMLGQ